VAIRLKGDTGLRLVSEERVFDEQFGFQTIATYEGLKASVDSAMGLMSLISGLRMKSQQFQGPWYRLTLSFAGTGDGSEEAPVDTWSRVTEFVQEDIRNNRYVVESASDLQTLAKWVKEIKEELKEADGTIPAGWSAAQRDIYKEYARGADSHEVRRTVIRRRRIIPIEFATPTLVQAIEPIYTRSALITTFEIPAEAQVLIPASPAILPPDNTAWAWKERGNTSDFVPSINKVEEVVEWTFAAWSLLLYDLFQ
jgi:hypothetical protein